MPLQLPEPTWANLYYPPADYVYFDNMPAFVTNQADLVRTNACWMVDAAILAYGKRQALDISPVEFEQTLRRGGFTASGLLGDWTPGAKGTQAFVAANERFAVISFRGTEKADWTDLLHDLMALPVKEGAVRVHQGFRDALDQVWGQVEHWVAGIRSSHPNAEICLTGHSLGAALAALAASRLQGPVSLYTFGCPRAGNGAFCDLVRQHAARAYRFVDGEDLVTHVPPKDFFYDHVGDAWQLTDPAPIHQAPPEKGLVELLGAIRVLGAVAEKLPADNQLLTPAETPLRDHSPGRYLFYMWKHFGGR